MYLNFYTVYQDSFSELSIECLVEGYDYIVNYMSYSITFYSDLQVSVFIPPNESFTIPGNFQLSSILDGDDFPEDPANLRNAFLSGKIRFSPEKFHKFINKCRKLLVFS